MYSKLKDFLTFYHEIRIPQHPFFIDDKNYNYDKKVCIISSPSRMGNHLLLSMLDSHPEIPRVPGEDGFLLFSFYLANYDLYHFLDQVKNKKNLEYLTKLSTNLDFNKWKNFKKLYKNKIIPSKYAGKLQKTVIGENILTRKNQSQIDYPGKVFDINYKEYEKVIKNRYCKSKKSNSFGDLLSIYLDALASLDFAYETKNNNTINGFLVASGMRTQLLWVLKYFLQSRVICSIRPFPSYVFSHIKSKYGNVKPTDPLVEEAWEHWYHKVIDLLYIKYQYPDRVCILLFDEIINNPLNTAKKLSTFLGVKYNEKMLSASIFGEPVMANTSFENTKFKEGEFSENNTNRGCEINFNIDYYNKIWQHLQTLNK